MGDGKRSEYISFGGVKSSPLVCVCEGLTVDNVRSAVDKLGAKSVVDLRRRTRLGMGGCMEHFCSFRAAGVLTQNADLGSAFEGVERFHEERWRGIRPVAWGEGLAAAQFTRWFYDGVCGLEEAKMEENE